MNPPQTPEIPGVFFSQEATVCPPKPPRLGELAVWGNYAQPEDGYVREALPQAPERLASVVTQFAAPEAYSKYILLDRCTLTTLRREGASTERLPENDVTQLRRSLSQWGDAGDNARLIVSELIGNWKDNTDDIHERWLMVFFNTDTNRLELEYHCFAPVSTRTFRDFRKVFRLSGPELAEKLYAGRERGQKSRMPKGKGNQPPKSKKDSQEELNDAGRGRALQVVSSDQATIDRHHFRHSPARTLPAVERGAHLRFKVRRDAPKREELAQPAEVSEDDLLAQFDEI